MTDTASMSDAQRDRRDRQGDPLDDLLDDVNSRERATVHVSNVRAGSGAWWLAFAATIVWLAAVASFIWGYFGLPFEWAAAREALATRLDTSDWLMIGAVTIAPIMMIWTIAALARRAAQMRGESRQLAGAAMRLARATENAERRGDILLPGPSLIGEISSPSPGHFRREVERATHAISALHAQMSAIEEALANQSASIDAAADRAETRARAITETLSAERAALQEVSDQLVEHKRAVANVAAGGSAAVSLGALSEHARATERHVENAGVRLAQSLDDSSERAEDAEPGETPERREPDILRHDEDAQEDIVDLSLSSGPDPEPAPEIIEAEIEPVETPPEVDTQSATVESLRDGLNEARRVARWPRVSATKADDALNDADAATLSAAPASKGAGPVDPHSPLASQLRQRHLEELREEMAGIQRGGGKAKPEAAPKKAEPIPPVAAKVEAPAPAPEAPRATKRDDDASSDTGKGATTALGAAASAAALGGAAMAVRSDRREDAIEDRLSAALAADARADDAAPKPAPEPRREPEPTRAAALDTALAADDSDDLKLPPPRSLNWNKLIRAANFPSSENDTETLDALYEVLTDPQTAAMLQAAEDTLASLADLDLYMEDFTPAQAAPSAWVAHLGGGEGGLAGVNAPAEVGRITSKLKSDPGFRRLLERFCERYEDMARRMRQESGVDALLLDLADTRSGRAYMMSIKALDGLA